MKHKGILIAGLVMLLAGAVQAQVTIPDPLPAFNFSVTPSSPTSQDILTLRVSGMWPSNCTPDSADVVVDGNTIEVRLLLPGASDCNEPNCTPVLSAYEVNVSAGPVPANTYTVLVRVVSCRETSSASPVARFTVGASSGGGGGEPNLPITIGPGTCVVLLQDVNDNGVLLRAGQAGMVVCCDAADCNGLLRVGWFAQMQGSGTSADCVGNTPRAMQPASSTWVDPSRVGLGICFDRCGVLGQNEERCFTLTTDDGQVYLLVAGSWLPDFLAPNGDFELGERVRVQGLIELERPSGAFFSCTAQNGDIFNPVITPCAPAGGGGGCCAAGYEPGDRVRLLVDNPPDLTGHSGTGLPAGTLGTVVCCNSNNADFTVFVSWDNFTGGFNMGFLCDTTPGTYPANSGWWVSCDDIVLLSGGGNGGGGGGQPCPNDMLTIGFGTNGVRLFRDPSCPTTSRTFSNCVTATVTANFRAKLSLSITPMAGIGGTWQGTITPNIVPAGQSNVQVCVTADNLNLAAIPAGQNTQVATVSILAVPEPAP